MARILLAYNRRRNGNIPNSNEFINHYSFQFCAWLVGLHKVNKWNDCARTSNNTTMKHTVNDDAGGCVAKNDAELTDRIGMG